MVRVQVRRHYKHGCTISKLVQLTKVCDLQLMCFLRVKVVHSRSGPYIEGHLAFFFSK